MYMRPGLPVVPRAPPRMSYLGRSGEPVRVPATRIHALTQRTASASSHVVPVFSVHQRHQVAISGDGQQVFFFDDRVRTLRLSRFDVPRGDPPDTDLTSSIASFDPSTIDELLTAAMQVRLVCIFHDIESDRVVFITQVTPLADEEAEGEDGLRQHGWLVIHKIAPSLDPTTYTTLRIDLRSNWSAKNRRESLFVRRNAVALNRHTVYLNSTDRIKVVGGARGTSVVFAGTARSGGSLNKLSDARLVAVNYATGTVAILSSAGARGRRVEIALGTNAFGWLDFKYEPTGDRLVVRKSYGTDDERGSDLEVYNLDHRDAALVASFGKLCLSIKATALNYMEILANGDALFRVAVYQTPIRLVLADLSVDGPVDDSTMQQVNTATATNGIKSWYIVRYSLMDAVTDGSEVLQVQDLFMFLKLGGGTSTLLNPENLLVSQGVDPRRRMVVYTSSGFEIWELGRYIPEFVWTPSTHGSAPRATRRVVATFTELRTLADPTNAITLLPNELLFEIYQYL